MLACRPSLYRVKWQSNPAGRVVIFYRPSPRSRRNILPVSLTEVLLLVFGFISAGNREQSLAFRRWCVSQQKGGFSFLPDRREAWRKHTVAPKWAD